MWFYNIIVDNKYKIFIKNYIIYKDNKIGYNKKGYIYYR